MAVQHRKEASKVVTLRCDEGIEPFLHDHHSLGVKVCMSSEDLSRHVILQVANALEYLHEEAGVVHRLVSPGLV